MPLVDVLDDTFVRAERTTVRRVTGDRWSAWLPRLRLVDVVDRGAAGVRWRAAAVGPGPALTGSAEVWLEAVPAGTVVHLYVRLDLDLDPGPGAGPARAGWRRRPRPDRLPDSLRRTWKRGLNASKDQMEGEWSG